MTRTPRTATLALALAGSLLAAAPKVVVPANGVPPVGPYSPGLDTGDYLYISGQGVRDSKSQMPAGIDAQTTQCIENVRGILAAAGLGFGDVVSVQMFLADLKTLPAVDKIYLAAFPKNPPRVVLGVSKMPTDTTVEITVVARKPTAKADRVFVPAVYGTSTVDVEAKLAAELKKSGLTPKNVLFVNRYVVGSTATGVVPVTALANGATHAVFAIAAKTPPSGSAYCEVVASDPKGTIEAQTADAFAKLKACLAGKGFGLEDAVATNVYLDDINDFAKMNAVYATYFAVQKPTRTTIQPAPAGSKSSLVRLAAVAAK